MATPATLRVNVGHEGEPGRARLTLKSDAIEYEAAVFFATPGSVTLPVPSGEMQAYLEIISDHIFNDVFHIAPTGRDPSGFLISADDDPLDIFVELGTASVVITPPADQDLESPIFIRLVEQRGSTYQYTSNLEPADSTNHIELPRIMEGTYHVDRIEAVGFQSGSRCYKDSILIQFTAAAQIEVPGKRTLRGRFLFPWMIEGLDQITVESRDGEMIYPLVWEGFNAGFEAEVACYESYTLWLPHPDSLNTKVLYLAVDFSDPSSLDLEWEFAGLEVSIETDEDVLPFHLETRNHFWNDRHVQSGPGVARLLVHGSLPTSLTYVPSQSGVMPPRQDWTEPGSESIAFTVETGETRQVTWAIQPGGSVRGILTTPLTNEERITWVQRNSYAYPLGWPIELEADGRTFHINQIPPGETRLYRHTRTERADHVDWWYPGTYRWRDAEAFEIRSGETVTGIDF